MDHRQAVLVVAALTLSLGVFACDKKDDVPSNSAAPAPTGSAGTVSPATPAIQAQPETHHEREEHAGGERGREGEHVAEHDHEHTGEGDGGHPQHP